MNGIRRILTPSLTSVLLSLLCAGLLHAGKPRVFVLTDISNEADDEESLVRFLVYANEYDIEGLVAATITWLRSQPQVDLLRRQIEAYPLVRQNLLKHPFYIVSSRTTDWKDYWRTGGAQQHWRKNDQAAEAYFTRYSARAG